MEVDEDAQPPDLIDRNTGELRGDLTEEELDQLGDELARDPEIAPVLIHLFRVLDREFVAPERQTLTRGLLLTAATAAFETLLAALLSLFYGAHPEALGDEQKFSLSDLEAFDSIDDAREDAIGRKVDSVLHGDISEWSAWLERNTKLRLDNLTIDYATLFEILQRRHVILHAGSRASRLYCRRMREFGVEPPSVGARLDVTDAYLERAFDELQALGSLLVVGIWAKAYPNEEKVALHGLYLESYDLMLDRRWAAAEKICAIGKLSRDNDESARQVFQANEWLALKRQHGIDRIREEVEAWDTSALGRRFRFMQKVLIDDLDAAFLAAKNLMRTGQLDEDDLLEWPALSEMRADERFGELIASDISTSRESTSSARPDQSDSEP